MNAEILSQSGTRQNASFRTVALRREPQAGRRTKSRFGSSDRSFLSALFTFVAIFAMTAQAKGQRISIEALADQLVSNDLPVIVDVRLSSRYAAGHIPNAINIPLPALESRRLPRLGQVVVYGDGMGRSNVERAVALLNAKPGIQAVALDGGYAAWETRSGLTTANKGLHPERKPVITYDDLVATGGRGIVVYDLRDAASAPPEVGGARLASVNASEGARDLRALLPMARQEAGSPLRLLEDAGPSLPSGGARLMASESDGRDNPLLRRAAMRTDELIILVDDDHQTAERTAQRLRAGGFERVAVLAGGDLILEFEGRPGLERQGAGAAPGATVGSPNSEEEEQ